jgi:predicted nucleotidyltransferase component of viral defense system
MALLHENLRFKSILETIAEQKQIDIKMVEKDYWIMHSLWGLQKQKFDFYLKGGTSLSKGFNAIARFSEDRVTRKQRREGFSSMCSCR